MVVLLPLLARSAEGAEPIDFRAQVAPILLHNCLDCHNDVERKGGLALQSNEMLLAGGESGPAILPGQAAESLLYQKVVAGEMPPEGRLSEVDSATLHAWIEQGAVWSGGPLERFAISTEHRAGRDWWSLQAPRRALPPAGDNGRAANPIDRFVHQALKDRGLSPSPQAHASSLVRRLSLDLLGLPPDPKAVRMSLAGLDDKNYELLLKQYLDSPQYGERWARHWLDVVRFGESQGFERDKLRPNAWPYRDWVIASLNDDLPYNEFVADQIAGDVRKPNDPRGLIATGFLTAGPWDEVGQTQQSEAMKRNVRQDELEDVVTAVCQTFLGLTVNCARCHDHKFDPIPQSDYYAMAAVFAGLHHGERTTSPAGMSNELIKLREEFQANLTRMRSEIDALEQPALLKAQAARPKATPPTPTLSWSFENEGELSGQPGALECHDGTRIQDGKLMLDGAQAYASTGPLPFSLREKSLCVVLSLANATQRGGAAISIQSLDGQQFDALVFGEQEPGVWSAGSEFFRRTQSFRTGTTPTVEVDTNRAEVHKVALVYDSDNQVTCYVDGVVWGAPYRVEHPAAFESGAWQILFGLRHTPATAGKHLAGELHEAALFDRALTADEVAVLHQRELPCSAEDILAQLTLAERVAREQLVLAYSHLESQSRLLESLTTYAVAPATPEPTFFLNRGMTTSPGDEVAPAGLSAINRAGPALQLSRNSTDAERRIALAEWLVHEQNPLIARVIVNRIWHYHFGVGIVESPNDFGFNGGRPSHAELLDWLACELISPEMPSPYRRPWSLKHIHWLIATSSTYRQSAEPRPEGLAADADNRLLWRMSPRRLDAESLRDAILAVSGQLNLRMGGPGYQDFTTFVDNSQFYQMLDPIGHAFQRRTLYRTWVRSGRSGFLDVFDCPDPSAAAPRRSLSTTPQQALALLNDPFVLRAATAWAADLETPWRADADQALVSIYHAAYARAPVDTELLEAKAYVHEHGLAAFCRVVFNSNEFLYVY